MQKKTYIPGLNGVRAIAVIAVIWHHAGSSFAAGAVHLNGFLGVDVFFVLSGLLITSLLLAEQAAAGRIALTNFYIRRSLRIFPLYYAVLAILAAYFYFSSGASGQRAHFLSELPWLLSYLSNWVSIHSIMTVSWSLATEEQFYLVWPPILAWLGYRSLWPLVLFLFLNQLLNFGFFAAVWPSLGVVQAKLNILQITFTPILLGVLLAFALRSGYREWFQRLTAGAALNVWALLLVLIALYPGDMQGLPRLAFHAVTAMVLAGIFLHPESRLVRGLECWPLVFVGTVSYGVYLLHMIVLGAAQKMLSKLQIELPGGLFFPCAIGAIILAATSYFALERPLLRMKDRWQGASASQN